MRSERQSKPDKQTETQRTTETATTERAEHDNSWAIAARYGVAAPPPDLKPSDVLALQRTIGNRAVQHLVCAYRAQRQPKHDTRGRPPARPTPNDVVGAKELIRYLKSPILAQRHLSKIKETLKPGKGKAWLRGVERQYAHQNDTALRVINEGTPQEYCLFHKKGEFLPSRTSPLRVDLKNALGTAATDLIAALEGATRLKGLSPKEVAEVHLNQQQRRIATQRAANGKHAALAKWLFDDQNWVQFVSNQGEWSPSNLGFFVLPTPEQVKAWPGQANASETGDQQYLSQIAGNLLACLQKIDEMIVLSKQSANIGIIAGEEAVKQLRGLGTLGLDAYKKVWHAIVKGTRHKRILKNTLLPKPELWTPPTTQGEGSSTQGRKTQRAVIQRALPPTGPAAQESKGAVTLAFVFRVPDSGYLNQMVSYLQTTHGVQVRQVTGIQEMFDQLKEFGKTRQRVNRLIIVAHGRRVNPGRKGGGAVKMRQSQEKKEAPGVVRWVTPDEVMKFAKTSAVAKTVRDKVMAPGAVAEFWGCNIGAYHSALRAWSTALGSEFRAIPERLITKELEFATKPTRKRPRQLFTHTSQIDNHKSQRLKEDFRKWCVQAYDILVSTGEIDKGKIPRKRDEKIAYIRDLFDRSGGKIRRIAVQNRGSKQNVYPSPAQMGQWLTLWKSVKFDPMALAD